MPSAQRVMKEHESQNNQGSSVVSDTKIVLNREELRQKIEQEQQQQAARGLLNQVRPSETQTEGSADDDLKMIIQTPESTQQPPSKKKQHLNREEDYDEDFEDPDDDYADIEHDFDNDENEEALLKRLEKIGDSGRNKHKTFEGIPKQWHQTIRVKNPET